MQDNIPLKILFFGDVVGKLGRQAVAEVLPKYMKKHQPHFVIANAENLAHGFGITRKSIEEMMEAGVDFFTSGNHIWKKKDGYELLLEPHNPVIRPFNYPPMNPGIGYKVLEKSGFRLLVVSLMGRVFMREHVDCPFRAIDAILRQFQDERLNGVLVDFHAEASSEKAAFFHYVNGRLSAVLGTHTHVPTADGLVSEQGTAFITDVGMCGPADGVIGHKKEQVIQRFLTQIETTHEVLEEGSTLVNGVLVALNPENKRAISIERVSASMS